MWSNRSTQVCQRGAVPNSSGTSQEYARQVQEDLEVIIFLKLGRHD